jgi:cysteinyl-tRNA synthetase
VTLNLYNTLTRQKAAFEPIDRDRVRMYVCGPTVYDHAHVGNARPIIVFDLLFRLLRHTYGEDHVVYARNITDVDDNINKRAAEEGVSIGSLTERTTRQFHADIAELGVLPPTVEPRATGHIDEMKVLIEGLIAKGNAYVAEEHVLFHVPSMPDYGRLSGRSLDEMLAGARVDVAPYKRDPMDFVLWKPSKAGDPSWPSPAGIKAPGRPGWHIECSAMAEKHLGALFDIHGGGIDLVFPHHENELAQSRCAHSAAVMANVWMHNGFLMVDGEKMSKSLGNFITINQLLRESSFGGRPWHGRIIRLAMLGTHYRQPIDWTAERLQQARGTLIDMADALAGVAGGAEPDGEILAALEDDLNTPQALSILYGKLKSARRGNAEGLARVAASARFLGIWDGETRADLTAAEPKREIDAARIEELIGARLAARRRKDFKEADRIRDEIVAMGVAIKDGKDPRTGEPVTTWEEGR